MVTCGKSLTVIKIESIFWHPLLSVPIALKKIGTYIGKFKNTLSNLQKEVSSVTKEVDFDEEVLTDKNKIKKDSNKNGWK